MEIIKPGRQFDFMRYRWLFIGASLFLLALSAFSFVWPGPKLGTDFAIPMFFIEGEHDLLATPDVAQRYYDSLKAPAKGIVILPHAGHDPNQDVVDAEYRVIKQRVLPLIR